MGIIPFILNITAHRGPNIHKLTIYFTLVIRIVMVTDVNTMWMFTYPRIRLLPFRLHFVIFTFLLV